MRLAFRSSGSLTWLKPPKSTTEIPGFVTFSTLLGPHLLSFQALQFYPKLKKTEVTLILLEIGNERVFPTLKSCTIYFPFAIASAINCFFISKHRKWIIQSTCTFFQYFLPCTPFLNNCRNPPSPPPPLSSPSLNVPTRWLC